MDQETETAARAVLGSMEAQDFGWALAKLRSGLLVRRTGWNAPGQYVAYQAGYPDGIEINANTARATGLPEGTLCRFNPYLMLRGADGSFSPWAPSIGDVLAEDWKVVIIPR